MTQHANATCRITAWDEEPYDETPGMPKLTRARVAKAFSGELEGDAGLEYLIMHRDDGSAGFIGLERFVGRLGDRDGSFVLQHTGEFEGGTAAATCTVVPGSGTGELAALEGQGRFAASHAQEYSFSLEYQI